MDVRLKFLGGAKTVTGSKYLLEVGPYQVMVDCGLFQGPKELRLRNWEWLPVDAFKIDSIILTHAHLDHVGYLPRLFRSGYQGRVVCTEATAKLMEILLRDTAKLQVEEAKFARKQGYSRHQFPRPLYDLDDVEETLPNIQTVKFDDPFILQAGVTASFHAAGHILGASSVVIQLEGDHQTKRILFSGDLGRYNQPLMPDPTPFEETDILLIESTYGDRDHGSESPRKTLGTVLTETFEQGGTAVIPAFSVGRTQTLLYYLWELFQEQAINDVPVFIDSPMAINVTKLYRNYDHLHKLDTSTGAPDLFGHPNFHYVNTQEDSIKLNEHKGPCIIISASGMCTGGRVLHHLYHRLRRPEDTVILAGHQGIGTRGRSIADGEAEVRIFGEYVPIRCRVEQLEHLSAHADQSELLRWLKNFKKAPKQTFIVHGEPKKSIALGDAIRDQLGWANVTVPDYLETVRLFEGI